MLSEEAKAVEVNDSFQEADMYFSEYTGEGKKGKCWLFATWGRRLVSNKLVKT